MDDPLYDEVAKDEGGLEMFTLPRRRAPPVPVCGVSVLNRSAPMYGSLGRSGVTQRQGGLVKGLTALYEVKFFLKTW